MCDMCAGCGGMSASVNYAKQIDPPARQYGTILGDTPQETYSRRYNRSPTPSIQMCLPTLAGPPPRSTGHHSPGQQPSIIQVPCDPVKPCPKFVCEPCPPPPPTKVWLIKSSPIPQKAWFSETPGRLHSGLERFPWWFRKSVCLPVGGSEEHECPFTDKIMLCFPCEPVTNEPEKKPEKEKPGPVGLISRNKDMDLIGGKIVSKCTCGRKNGLSGDDCPRVSCQNNPGCAMRPPRCWPQYKEPEPPPPPLPDQKLFCVPIQLVYQPPPPS